MGIRKMNGRLIKSGGKLGCNCCCENWWPAVLCSDAACPGEGLTVYVCTQVLCPGSEPISNGTVIKLPDNRCFIVDTDSIIPTGELPPDAERIVALSDCQENCDGCPAIDGYLPLVPCDCSTVDPKTPPYVSCSCYNDLIEAGTCPTFYADGVGCVHYGGGKPVQTLPKGAVDVGCSNWLSCCNCCVWHSMGDCGYALITPFSSSWTQGCEGDPPDECHLVEGDDVYCCCVTTEVELNGHELFSTTYASGCGIGTIYYRRDYVACRGDGTGNINIFYIDCAGNEYPFPGTGHDGYNFCMPPTMPTCSVGAPPWGNGPGCGSGTSSFDCINSSMRYDWTDGAGNSGFYEASFNLSTAEGPCTNCRPPEEDELRIASGAETMEFGSGGGAPKRSGERRSSGNCKGCVRRKRT